MSKRNRKLLVVLGLSLVAITIFIIGLSSRATSNQSPADTSPANVVTLTVLDATSSPQPDAAVKLTEGVKPTLALSTATPIITPTLPVTTLLPPPNPQVPPVYGYTIINTYPHDRDSYTQGLIYLDGVLYEGSGLYGRSTLRRVDLPTGNVEQIHYLPVDVFGEGITIFNDKIIQLTWQSGKGFVYDRATFEVLREFTYPTQGWGITHNGKQLIMSDGSANLYFWDPETLQELWRVEVRDQNGPVVKLNELEYINGEVYANIYQTNLIARIDPSTGRVTGWIELSGLLTPADLSEPVDVLNGIAYDADGDRLFVTGKLWPKLFEITLIPYQ